MAGATIDFEQELIRSAFAIVNNPQSECDYTCICMHRIDESLIVHYCYCCCYVYVCHCRWVSVWMWLFICFKKLRRQSSNRLVSKWVSEWVKSDTSETVKPLIHISMLSGTYMLNSVLYTYIERWSLITICSSTLVCTWVREYMSVRSSAVCLCNNYQYFMCRRVTATRTHTHTHTHDMYAEVHLHHLINTVQCMYV
jgi:hypothetical protein